MEDETSEHVQGGIEADLADDENAEDTSFEETDEASEDASESESTDETDNGEEA